MPKIALLQMTSGIDPDANTRTLVEAIGQAAEQGATMLFTPEMSGLLDRDRKRAAAEVTTEARSPVLAAVREAAQARNIWVSLGSLALDTGEGRWANRGFAIDGEGAIRARYDKIHMFDVDLDSGESWRESNAYKAGGGAVSVPDTPLGRLGLTICYDIRFPALFDALGRERCDVIAIPAAFTVPTGKAHWPYGHSLVVDPWGEVLLDMGGDAAGLAFCDIDLARIAEVRAQVPSLANRRQIAN